MRSISYLNNLDIYLKELSPEDSLVVLVENYLAAKRKVEIETDLPDLAEFNTDYCTVNYLYYGSDEVEVNFFQGSFYNRETLKNLLNIKDQIVRLNMQNMPLKKEDLDEMKDIIGKADRIYLMEKIGNVKKARASG